MFHLCLTAGVTAEAKLETNSEQRGLHFAPASRPTQEDVQAICSTFAEQMLEGLPGCERRDVYQLFPTASNAVDTSLHLRDV